MLLICLSYIKSIYLDVDSKSFSFSSFLFLRSLIKILDRRLSDSGVDTLSILTLKFPAVAILTSSKFENIHLAALTRILEQSVEFDS